MTIPDADATTVAGEATVHDPDNECFGYCISWGFLTGIEITDGSLISARFKRHLSRCSRQIPDATDNAYRP